MRSIIFRNKRKKKHRTVTQEANMKDSLKPAISPQTFCEGPAVNATFKKFLYLQSIDLSPRQRKKNFMEDESEQTTAGLRLGLDIGPGGLGQLQIKGYDRTR